MEPLENSVLMMAGVNLDFDLTFIIQLAIVLVLMVILKTFVFDVYLATIDEREQKTDQTRDQADTLKAQAEEIAGRYEDALTTARSEANQIRQTLRLEGVAHKDKAISGARGDAQSHLESAQVAVDAEMETARGQVAIQVDEISSLVVSKIIGRNV
jgi:F-type H+-transporting ATPase subunit b